MPPLPTGDLDFILARTAPLWEEIRKSRLFLTGGTGFFGCWLVESFLEANRRFELNAEIVVLTRSPDAFLRKCSHLANDRALSLLQGDVCDFEFPSGEFRFVIHAATEASAKLIAEEPLRMLSTTLEGTKHTLEFAATHGTQKFLLTSSGAVYGEQPSSISHIREDYAGAPNALDPTSVYSEGKRTSELMCAVYRAAYGIECKVARCFAFIGPHLPLNAHFAIGNFLRDAMNGDTIQIVGDGTPKRSYMYAADLAIWLWTILFRAPSMEAFNVGSAHAISIAELAQAVSGAIGSSAACRISQKAVPGARARQYVPCVQKAEQQLGLKCEVSLEDAIRRTAAWHGYAMNAKANGRQR